MFVNLRGKKVNELIVRKVADPNFRAVYGLGLRPLVFWDCGF
jgi:hypothetical protein